MTFDELADIPADEFHELGRGHRLVAGPNEFWATRVFRVRDYAIKFFDLRIMSIGQFIREARAWEDLTEIDALKDYMPQFCWWQAKDRRGYILQRYESTTSLRSILTIAKDIRGKVTKPIPYKIGTRLFRRLITGLKELNAAGYLHRDIKPENILVRTGIDPSDRLYGAPLFIDFDLVCKMPCYELAPAGTRGYIPENWYAPHNRKNKPGINKGKNKTIRFVEHEPMFSFKRNIFKPIRTQPAALRAAFSIKTDEYALAKVLEELWECIDWTGQADKKEKYEKQIIYYKSRMAGELAAQKARGNIRGVGEYFRAEPPAAPAVLAAPAAVRNTRKRKPNNNGNLNKTKRAREGNRNF